MGICGPKMVQKKVEFEGVGPIWRDPRRNSVQKAVPGVPYGGMATHLVTKRCDFGSLGVLAPASTRKPNQTNPPWAAVINSYPGNYPQQEYLRHTLPMPHGPMGPMVMTPWVPWAPWDHKGPMGPPWAPMDPDGAYGCLLYTSPSPRDS